MGLPALQLLERRNVGVGIVERDDEAERDLVVLLVVEEPAAPRVAERPALGVDHSPGLMFLRRNVPQLLDTETENLWPTLVTKLEDLGQPLGQMAPRAFGEQGVFGVQLEARLVVGPMRAVARDPHVAGRHPLHGAVVVEEDLGGGEAGENLDSQLLRLPRQPAAEIAEAQRVRPLVVHERGQEEVRHRELAALAEDPVVILADRHGQRRALVVPVRDQLVERLRVEHGAGQDVRPDLTAFLQDADRNVASGRIRQLLEADRRGQAGGAAADNHHVIGHGFALAHDPPLAALPTQFDSSALPIP